MSRKYQPSNGTEGMMFTEEFCEQCIHERWCHFPEEDKDEDKCEIWSNTMIYDVKDPEYPKEWVYDDDDTPTCTAWKKWDWGGPDDDDRREPPPEPDPPDPDQLSLFPMYPDERNFEEKEQLINVSIDGNSR